MQESLLFPVKPALLSCVSVNNVPQYVKVVNAGVFSNAFKSSVVTPAGIVKDESEVAFLKTLPSIVVTEAGKLTVVSEVADSNIDSPMYEISAGSVTEVSEVAL